MTGLSFELLAWLCGALFLGAAIGWTARRPPPPGPDKELEALLATITAERDAAVRRAGAAEAASSGPAAAAPTPDLSAAEAALADAREAASAAQRRVTELEDAVETAEDALTTARARIAALEADATALVAARARIADLEKGAPQPPAEGAELHRAQLAACRARNDSLDAELRQVQTQLARTLLSGAVPEAPGVLLPAPREGGPHDLTRIRGIDADLAARLQEAGLFHFDQLSRLGVADVAWLSRSLDLPPERIFNERWITQAAYHATTSRG